MPPARRFVYILKSQNAPTRYDTGVTADVLTRLAAHNNGRCPYTARSRPWSIDVVVEFTDEERPVAFEGYFEVGIRQCVRQATLALTRARRRPSVRVRVGAHSCARGIRAHIVVDCAKATSAPPSGFPVEVSSIGSVAERSEIPTDCKA
jgi:predicted GIY-YIG superfamily endonuclease